MAELDGSIRIGVVFDEKSFKNQMKQVDKVAEATGKNVKPINPFKRWNRGTVKKIVGEIEEYNAGIDEASKETNEMLDALEQAKKAVKNLGDSGKFFGDKEYDDAIKKLEQIRANIKLYKKELVTPPKSENPFGLDTLSGRIREAEIELDRLYQSGKGLGDIEYDKAYHSLILLKEEARNYRAELEMTPAKLQAIAEKEAAAAAKAEEAAKKAAEKRAAAAEEAARLQEIADGASVADQRIVDLNQELADLNARMKELQNAGVGLGYEEYDNITSRIAEINDELREYKANLETLPEPDVSKWEKIKQEIKSGFIKTVNAASQAVKTGFKKSVDAASASTKKLLGRIKDVGRSKGFEKAAKSAEGFAKRLKSIVAGAFVFNVISRGLSALTAQIGKYLTANQKFSDALNGIKSNLLTAFQPIYEAVMPALTALMETLERVTAKFAAFIATIFGTTASKAQENAEALYEQANATKETGKEAKKAEKELKKYLASFDTIEKLGEEKVETEVETKLEATETQGPQFDTAFEQVEVPQWLLDFWKVFQDSWEQYGSTTMQAFKEAVGAIGVAVAAIGAAFMAAWTGGNGMALLEAFHRLLQEILLIIRDIATAFTLVWTSGVGEEILHNLFSLLQPVLTIIYSIAAAFREAWNSGTGEVVISAILGALNSVLKLLVSIGQAFIEAWNDNDRGVTICNTILKIIANIFDIVKNLADRFREAWEANDNGVKIWGAILDIIKIILETVEKITAATAEWAKTIDFEPLVSGLRKALEDFAPLAQKIGDMVVEFWESTVLPFLTWLIEDALPQVLEWLAQLFKYLAENPETIATLTKLVIAFIAAWEVATVINAIAEVMKHFKLLGALISLISGQAVTGIASIATKLSGPLMAGIKAVFAFISAHPIVAVIAAVSAALVLLIANWEKVKETVSNVINAIVSFIQNAIDKVKEFFSALSGGDGKGGKAVVDYGGSGRSSAPQMASYDTPAMFSMADMPRIASYSAELTSLKSASIPQMARSAVSSPNNDFIAGKSSMSTGNEGVSLGSIEQAIESAFERYGRANGDVKVTINYTGSLAQIGRVLNPVITVERARLGTDLVGGNA